MNKYHLRIFLLVFLLLNITPHLMAQTTEVEKNFMKNFISAQASQVLETEIENIVMQLDEAPFYIHKDVEGHTKTITYRMIAHDDMNEDGIDDYVLFWDVEGFYQGQQYKQGMLSIIDMKSDTEPKNVRNIITNQPCSWYDIDNIIYNEKKLSMKISRATCPNMPPVDVPESTTLSFVFDGDHCYEEGYRQKCKMAQMTDKTIFKKDLSNVTREVAMAAETYVDVANEFYKSEDMAISASINGCDNIYLTFVAKLDYTGSKKLLDVDSKAKIMSVIDFLVNNTRYKSVISKMKEGYEKQAYNSNASRKGSFDNIWKYEVSPLSYHTDIGKLVFSIAIYNEENLNQQDAWDIIMKRK